MTRGPSSLLLIYTVMILFHANICKAATSLTNNTSTTIMGCNGDQGECLVVDLDFEEQFFMGSETSDSKASGSTEFNIYRLIENRGKAIPCGVRPYAACLSTKNIIRRNPEKCGLYKRRCWCWNGIGVQSSSHFSPVMSCAYLSPVPLCLCVSFSPVIIVFEFSIV